MVRKAWPRTEDAEVVSGWPMFRVGARARVKCEGLCSAKAYSARSEGTDLAGGDTERLVEPRVALSACGGSGDACHAHAKPRQGLRGDL